MQHFIMNSDDIKTNLEFALRYPLHKTVTSALNRFHQLQDYVDKLPKSESNRDLIFRCLNECDFILNTLEGYDL